jgi:hypothetical protein
MGRYNMKGAAMRFVRTTLAGVHPLAVSCLILLVLAVAGCSETGEKLVGTDPGKIEGVVTIGGAPVETAVSVDLRTGSEIVRTEQTGAGGTFSFNGVAPGAYELFVTPPTGYSPDAPLKNPIPVTVHADRTSDVVIPLVESASLPEARIAARVTGDGAPMMGVAVTVYENNTNTVIATKPTDDQGVADFPLDAGLYGVGIEIPMGYELESPSDNPIHNIWAQSNDSSTVFFRLRTIGEGDGEGVLSVWISDPDSLNVDPEPPLVAVNVYDGETATLVTSGTARIYGGVTFTLAAGTYSVGIVVPTGYELFPDTQQNPLPGVIVRSRETTRSHFSITQTK